ncbi:MAG: hypothetical protein Q8N98_00575, partial [bacterium]|nr:hypothetical protein [bacterium]
MKNNKGLAPILIVLMIVGVLALGGGTYYFLTKRTQKPVSCTLEAKICPDGSAVGRTSPNCEFAQCPTAKPEETADWKTHTDSNLNYSFQYPPTSCEPQRKLGDTSLVLCYLPKGSDG